MNLADSILIAAPLRDGIAAQAAANRARSIGEPMRRAELTQRVAASQQAQADALTALIADVEGRRTKVEADATPSSFDPRPSTSPTP